MTAFALGSISADKLSINNLFNVQGWVVIVTGGGTGLGLVTAKALAYNGATVYITGRRGDVLEKAAKEASPKEGKGSIRPIQGDASTKEGIANLVKAIEGKEKWINLLVNNHGVSQEHPDINACEQTPEGLSKKMFGEEKMETWLSTYTINTASYYFTTFALLPLLAAAKTIGGFPEPGNVINIASMSGVTKTSQRGQFSYNAGKAATISLSHQLATEFARRDLGIRVNVINPGYFPSSMTVIDPSDNQSTEEHKKKFQEDWGIPFGRPGGPEDYAQCIFSLAVNQYMTGAAVDIDGGWLLKQGELESLSMR